MGFVESVQGELVHAVDLQLAAGSVDDADPEVGEAAAVHMSLKRISSERGTDTMARPWDSENNAVNRSTPSRSTSSSSAIRAPTP
ncbi:hypothetical protein AHiyo8_29530 [Arthrobacter sp. Hiyo8]|nr:hypothetical protein AHiyo8_29530 [Arthrobacter sp. Hiyo8]